MATMDELLAQIRQGETGNQSDPYTYYSTAPNSHASGAYQFQPGTWQQYTQESGIGTQYSEAYQAPPAVQDQVAAYAVQNGPGVNSSALWGASAKNQPGGAYPSLDANSTIAQGPDQLDTQLGTASGNAGGTIPGTGSSLLESLGLQNPANAQATAAAATSGTGFPLALGMLPGVGQAISDWLAGIENAVGTQVQNMFAQFENIFLDLFERGFLLLLGALIALVAIWRLMDPEGTKTAAVVKTAAVAA